jgi:ABC-type Fe3+ transport system substrate-binding protein
MYGNFAALTVGIILALVVMSCGLGGPGSGGAAISYSPDEQKLVDAVKNAGETEVLWWTTASVDQKTLLDPFEARYPFLKLHQQVVFPSQGGTRLIEEAKTGQTSVDIVTWVDNAVVLLHSAGLLAENTWPGTSDWKHQPNHNFWRGPGISSQTPALVNTQVLARSEWPTSMDDLKNPKYAGQVVASTSRETVILETAAVWKRGSEPDWDRATAYWTDVVRATRPAVTQGFEAPMERFAAGEFGLFLNAAVSNTVVMLQHGAPLAIPPLPYAWGYNESIAILKGAQHPNAARLLAYYLTTAGLLGMVDSRGLFANVPAIAKQAKANTTFPDLTVQIVDPELLTPPNLRRSADIWHGLLGLR